ncbi:MAG: glycosyltransferase family 61 protein [Alphaproteobacteria bacterium]
MAVRKFSARHWRYVLGRTATRFAPSLRDAVPFYDDVHALVRAGETESLRETQEIALDAGAAEFAARLRTSDRLPERVDREISLVRLHNVTVLGNTGAIIDEPREKLLQYRDGLGFASYHDFRAERTTPVTKLNSNYFHMVGAHSGHRHLFHFLLERLPRLHYLLERFPLGREPLVVLTNESLPRFQQDIYGFLAARFPGLRFEAVPRGERWRLPMLHAIDVFQPVKRTLASTHVLDFIRGLVFDGYGLSPSGEKRRLYLTRSDTKKRRIANENELAPLLRERGFEIVAPGKLSFRDQAALFQWADAIAGPHGAGLTNVLFAPKAARILEIFPADKVKNTYLLLAYSLGQTYRGLVAGKGGRQEWFRAEARDVVSALDELLQ